VGAEPPALQPGPPANLHVRGSSGASHPLLERAEQKFFVVPRRMGLALALVRRTCRWDDQYPEEQINSLYFDTVDLDQHEKSLEGEFAKDKVRVRWYGEADDPHRAGARIRQLSSALQERPVQVWLELKSRRGFASTKQRVALEVEASSLAFGSLAGGIVPEDTLMRTMASFGFLSAGRLLPVVAVSYWRCRFVEPRTGMRVSLDSRIRSSMIMPGIGRGERGLEMPGVVVEVKGPAFDLPVALRELADLGSSWTRYSKYSSSLDAHMAAMGSVSRLWPSGALPPVD
jgi:hypothetical protein